jgi:hypothetical protein
MKKLFLALIAFSSLAVAAQDNGVINDANAQKRTLNAGFTAISVSDGIDLYLSQGNEESVAVSVSDNKYLDRFKTEVVNGTLKIYYDHKGLSWSSDKRKLTAYVSFKTLEKLEGSSGSDVSAKSSLELGNFGMSFSSGSSFNGKLSAKQLSIEQSSGSDVNISGKAEKITVALSSGAAFNGYDLAVDYCDAKASSGGELHITINKELNAKASSGGEIRYKGEALIRDISISGGGAVKRS